MLGHTGKRRYGLPIVALCLILGVVACARYLGPLPSRQAIYASTNSPSSTILDQQGRLLYEVIDPHAGAHRPLQLDEIPLELRQAVVATEDASFYRNTGVDVVAVVRALWANLRSGRIVSGGSTITQQVARNLLLSEGERYEQSLRRKTREAVLALWLTWRLDKNEILTLYLNETYFGNLAYGVEAASRAYFGKPVGQLDLAECALLAGLPQAPSAYNPLTHPDAAKARQRVVLNLMVRSGAISHQRAEMAYNEPLRFASEPYSIEAPHAVMLVREVLGRELGEEVIRRGGLRVTTTLDLGLQRAAEDQVRRHLAALNTPSGAGRAGRPTTHQPGHNVHNAAAVVLDPYTGAVRAMVGSPDYFRAENNGAVNAALALRQPGSSVKPITYAAAFAAGFSPASMFADVRTAFVTREGTPYVPVNYDYRYHGPVLLRQALASSYNVVAVQLLERIGLESFVATAQRLGITSLGDAERYGLALTLGSGEVSLLELTAAYGAFANGGHRVTPYLIERVEDRQGNLLYQAPQAAPERVLDERIAYLITDVLSDKRARAPAFGAGSPLDLPFPAAVKTGTTTEWRDNWTVGYSTEAVVGIWVGNANNEPMERVSGVSGAAPIWNGIMRAAHIRRPAPFARPAGLVEREVCAVSGLLPGPACTHRRRELFLAEAVPTRACGMHRLLEVDLANGEPVSPDTPSERRGLRAITVWPQELAAWAQEQGLAAAPLALAALAAPQTQPQGAGELPAEPSLRIVSPDPNSRYALAANIPREHQRVEVAVSAPASLGQGECTLWVDGQPWHRWQAPPYRVFWPLVPGEHEFRAEVLMEDSIAVRSAPVRIFVVTAEEAEKGTVP